MTKDKELIERLAIESFTYFGKTINGPLAVAICTRFLTAYLAERGEEAVKCEQVAFEKWARPDSVQADKNADGDYTERGMMAAWNGCMERAKLAKKPAIPEDMALEAKLVKADAVILQAKVATKLWKTASDNSEEIEFDDMAAYSTPMPIFCDADEATDEALAAIEQYQKGE